MRGTIAAAWACVVVGLPAAIPAVGAADAAGCQDPPVLERLSGCAIRECHGRDYDETELQTGPSRAGGPFPTALLDGRIWTVTYACPAVSGGLKGLARQAEANLRRSGYTVVYSGSMLYGDLPGFTARKGRDWVQLVAERLARQDGYTVTVVRATAEASPQ